MSNVITGRQLRAARILAGLTQKQLAKAVANVPRAIGSRRKANHRHQRQACSKRSKRCYAITT
jgi:hypothetical protein